MINKRYKILRLLGKGRSRVFLCSDAFYGSKLFALKLLNAKEHSAIASFRNEFETLRKMNHSNIIEVIDFGKVISIDKEDEDQNISQGYYFLIMEYFEGFELQNLPGIKKPDILMKVIEQIASVLYYLHQSNFIHYDIKPSNFLANYIDGGLSLKLIDFGFSKYFRVDDEIEIKGTPEFLAPEIIEKDFIDHRVDLFAFGMTLYNLIYNNFPFKYSSEIEIYSSILEKEFNFPKSDIPKTIIEACKNLLAKKSLERPYYSLSIFEKLQIPISKSMRRSFVPVKVNIDRKSIQNGLGLYFDNKEIGSILSIKGKSGSGKSSILNKLRKDYNNSILIGSGAFGEMSVWKNLVYDILYNFPIGSFSEDILVIANDLIEDREKIDIDKIKLLLNSLLHSNFEIFLFDGISNFDEISKEVFTEFIRLLQSNSKKIILTENSDYELISKQFSNVSILDIIPLNKTEMDEIIEVSFGSIFPKEELKSVMNQFGQLHFNDFYDVIEELINLDVLIVSFEGPIIQFNEAKKELIEDSQQVVMEMKLNDLSADEQLIAQYLSIFSKSVSEEIIGSITGYSAKNISKILSALRVKSIITGIKQSVFPEFVSPLLKNFIYKSSSNHEIMHLKAAEALEQLNLPNYREELSFQYLKAGKFDSYISTLQKQISALPKGFALNYKISLYNKILEVKLQERRDEILIPLAETYFDTGNYTNALENLQKISPGAIEEELELRRKILLGKCKIETGQPDEGVMILNQLLPSISEDEKIEVELLIVGGELDLNNYSNCRSILNKILKEGNYEQIATAYNLLALTEIYENSDLKKAAAYFRKSIENYELAGNAPRVAAIRLNLGNIFSMLGDKPNMLEQWKKSSVLNNQIGNLELEAKLMMNFGINNFDLCLFDEAAENYKKALAVFTAQSDTEGEGLAMINLSEVFLQTCEYQNAFEAIEKAKFIFAQANNLEFEFDTVFLLSKLYFLLGMRKEFKLQYDSIEVKFKDILITEVAKAKLSLLSAMGLVLSNENKDILPELKKHYFSIEFTDDRELKILKADLLFLLLNTALSKFEYLTCIDFLDQPEATKLIDQNVFYRAEREVILGNLHGKIENIKINTSIAHFQSAYRLIENTSIHRITYKILFELAVYYHKRGKFNDSAKYISYTTALIKMLADLIKDKTLKDAFLAEKAVKNIMDKLTIIERTLSDA